MACSSKADGRGRRRFREGTEKRRREGTHGGDKGKTLEDGEQIIEFRCIISARLLLKAQPELGMNLPPPNK